MPRAQTTRVMSPMSTPPQCHIHTIAMLNRTPMMNHDNAVLPFFCDRCLALVSSFCLLLPPLMPSGFLKVPLLPVSFPLWLPGNALAVQLQPSAVLPEQSPGWTLVCFRCVRPLLTLPSSNSLFVSATTVLTGKRTSVRSLLRPLLRPLMRPAVRPVLRPSPGGKEWRGVVEHL